MNNWQDKVAQAAVEGRTNKYQMSVLRHIKKLKEKNND